MTFEPKRRGYGKRTKPLYVSKALFEAVFGPWRRSEGRIAHEGGKGNPEPGYEGYDSRGGRYSAPANRRRRG